MRHVCGCQVLEAGVRISNRLAKVTLNRWQKREHSELYTWVNVTGCRLYPLIPFNKGGGGEEIEEVTKKVQQRDRPRPGGRQHWPEVRGRMYCDEHAQ